MNIAKLEKVCCLARLDPQKLYVEFLPGVTPTEPVMERKYTLTHSDATGQLFLTVGLTYAEDKITAMRDEVLGRWKIFYNQYSCYIYLHVDGESGGVETTAVRDRIFRKELPLALEAIRYGDRNFFYAHPVLNNAPIIVYFLSRFPQYSSVENWGTFSDYDSQLIF
jgi:hypothetical protein